MKKAVRLVPFAFEKSDAKEKYGGENVFSAMMGRPSLRYTATMVYNCDMQGGEQPEETIAVENEVLHSPWSSLPDEVFEEVGGAQLWRGARLVHAQAPRRAGGGN